MKHIGGFFEIELKRGNYNYHPNAIALTTGRACIHLILRELKPAKVYIPFYTCDATIDPFLFLKIPIEYYEIDFLLFPKKLPELKPNEYFFYTNYFGLKNKEVKILLERYGAQLIIDNTHSFFNNGYPGNWSFTSARKYFGVPDGAYLYAPAKISENFTRFLNISIQHNLKRLLGKQEEAYKQYVEYEKSLTSEIYAISLYSELALSHVDYDDVIEKRRTNFNYLEGEIGHLNHLHGFSYGEGVPFCYPFLPPEFLKREMFFENNIYIPSYWLDTINRSMDGYDFEKKISAAMLPLPIDHRYNIHDLKIVVDMIKKYFHEK